MKLRGKLFRKVRILLVSKGMEAVPSRVLFLSSSKVRMKLKQRQWRPFSIGLMPEKATDDTQAWLKLTEPDTQGVYLEELQAVAYYAAWPVQADIAGFKVSPNLDLTYTQKETSKLEEWIDSQRGEGDDSQYYIVEKKVTLKIHGGTVVAAIQTISPTRKGLVIQEAWEKEED